MNVYLDNSATTFPKPSAVEKAVMNWFKEGYGNANRSSGKGARYIEKIVYETRTLLCDLFHFGASDHVVFTKNVTEAINLVCFGYLQPKSHVIITTLEHNAVTRPLEYLKETGHITYSVVPLNSEGELDLNALKAYINNETKMIIATHASNVSGDILPIEKIGQVARDHGIVFMVDAAQSAGILPIDMKTQNIDILAFTGHKGLLGPQGIGGLLINPDIAGDIKPFIFGGTGSYSESLNQPDAMPDKYESGTLNTMAIAGLHAGIQTIKNIGLDRILEHEQQLIKILQAAFDHDKRVRMIGNQNYKKRVGVLSMDFLTIDNAIAAYELSKQFGITTRVGLHCSPLAHEAYGTFPQGTVRFSTSCLNTIEEMQYTVEAIKQILAMA